eukprot:1482090-Alexandrium_andersonii.AAC.1
MGVGGLNRGRIDVARAAGGPSRRVRAERARHQRERGGCACVRGEEQCRKAMLPHPACAPQPEGAE